MNDSNGDLQYAEQTSDATKGDLVFLKTKLETRPGDRLVSVHVTTVPVKLASSALKSVLYSVLFNLISQTFLLTKATD
jgi:hypothetical protein